MVPQGAVETRSDRPRQTAHLAAGTYSLAGSEVLRYSGYTAEVAGQANYAVRTTSIELLGSVTRTDAAARNFAEDEMAIGMPANKAIRRAG